MHMLLVQRTVRSTAITFHLVSKILLRQLKLQASQHDFDRICFYCYIFYIRWVGRLYRYRLYAGDLRTLKDQVYQWLSRTQIAEGSEPRVSKRVNAQLQQLQSQPPLPL